MKTESFEAPLTNLRVAVVIPCYKVTRHISDVISAIPHIVWRIYVVDDACPEGSGKFVEANIFDNRVRVVYHQQNQGVGGAVMTGYQAAIADGAGVIVKLTGMDRWTQFDSIFYRANTRRGGGLYQRKPFLQS